MAGVTLYPLAAFGGQAESRTDQDSPDDGQITPDIDQVIVHAINFCGPWPIFHQRAVGCEYAMLEKDDLPMVQQMRPELIDACLDCKGNQCKPKREPNLQPLNRFVCRRLFWTPKKVPGMLVRSKYDGPLRVSFSFTISINGQVEQVRLISNDSDISDDQLIELIDKGAQRVRFEPLVVSSKKLSVVDVRGRYIF